MRESGRIPALVILGLFAVPFSCTEETLLDVATSEGSGGTDSGQESAPGGTDTEGEGQPDEIVFTDREIELIRTRLGKIPMEVVADPSNAYSTDAKAALLGQKFYHDPRYSSTGDVSCATCHMPENGFQDSRDATSKGVDGFTGRRAQSHINAFIGPDGTNANFWFWDGRKDSQWSQALGPPESSVEMGSTRTKVAMLIFTSYRDEYESVFGPMVNLMPGGNAIAPETAMPGTAEWDALNSDDQRKISSVFANFGKAIDAYERLLISTGSRFDGFLSDVEEGNFESEALSLEERWGLQLFIGKGRCITCHNGPALSNNEFRNIGVRQMGPTVPDMDTGREGGIPGVLADEFNCQGEFSDHPDKDSCMIVGLKMKSEDRGSFKVPPLRDIATRTPYMHTGVYSSLLDVIKHYDRGGDADGFVGLRDTAISPLDLTSGERHALVAFLESLNGEALDDALIYGE